MRRSGFARSTARPEHTDAEVKQFAYPAVEAMGMNLASITKIKELTWKP